MPLLSNAAVPNPTFRTDMEGDYVLSLVVSDDMDESLPDTVTITATLNLAPTAVASANKVTGLAPLSIQFNGSASSDPENDALTYSWNFGDLSPLSSAVSPAHVYQNAGTYFATLTVTDIAGNSAWDSLKIVATAPNLPPTVNPTATPNSGSAPLTVQFAANASDPNNDPLYCVWDFGDPASGSNNWSTLENPTHLYTTVGLYIAWTSCCDGTYCRDATVTVIVESPMALSVAEAKIVQTVAKEYLGQITVKADFGGVTPSGDDLISMTLDGVTLIAQPFSAFHVGNGSNVYHFVGEDVFAEIKDGEIYVKASKVIISDVEAGENVVEIKIGEATAVESITLEEQGAIKRYLR